MEDSAKGWSDFGGKLEKNETPYKAALREGSEELTGFLGDKNTIHKLIRKNGGYYKIQHNTYHVHMFFLEYDENLPEYYNKNHQFLWNNMDKNVLNNSTLFEKIEIRWFCIDELKSRKTEFRSFYQEIIDKIFMDIENIVKFIKTKSKIHKKTRKLCLLHKKNVK